MKKKFLLNNRVLAGLAAAAIVMAACENPSDPKEDPGTLLPAITKIELTGPAGILVTLNRAPAEDVEITKDDFTVTLKDSGEDEGEALTVSGVEANGERSLWTITLDPPLEEDAIGKTLTVNGKDNLEGEAEVTIDLNPDVPENLTAAFNDEGLTITGWDEDEEAEWIAAVTGVEIRNMDNSTVMQTLGANDFTSSDGEIAIAKSKLNGELEGFYLVAVNADRYITAICGIDGVFIDAKKPVLTLIGVARTGETTALVEFRIEGNFVNQAGVGYYITAQKSGNSDADKAEAKEAINFDELGWYPQSTECNMTISDLSTAAAWFWVWAIDVYGNEGELEIEIPAYTYIAAPTAVTLPAGADGQTNAANVINASNTSNAIVTVTFAALENNAKIQAAVTNSFAMVNYEIKIYYTGPAMGEADAQQGATSATFSVDASEVPDGAVYVLARIWVSDTEYSPWIRSGAITKSSALPVLSGSVTNLGTETGTTATISFTSNSAGTYYYVVLPAASAAPGADTVMRQSYTDDPHGTGSVTASAAVTKDLTDLTPSTGYKAYIVVKDSYNNISGLLTIDGVNPVIDTSIATFTATQSGGVENKTSSTSIVLNFSRVVTGLQAGDITLTNGTGEAAKGIVLMGSGQTWTLALASVTATGTVSVSIDKQGFSNAAVEVTVYKTPWTAVTDSTFGTSAVVNIVAYGAGKFVAVGSQGMIAYSTDGVTWTAVTPLTRYNLIGVAYGGDKFVAVGAVNVVLYSSDGITWAAATGPFPQNPYEIRGIVYGEDKFVIGASAGKVAYSTDGVTWTEVEKAASFNGQIYGAAYGNGNFVVAGDNLNPSIVRSAYSADGTSWTAAATSPSSTVFSVAFGNGKFVAVGANGSIFLSEYGDVWTTSTPYSDGLFRVVAWVKDRFFAGDGAGNIITSANGETWEFHSNTEGAYTYGLAYNGEKLVAVGNSGKIFYMDY